MRRSRESGGAGMIILIIVAVLVVIGVGGYFVVQFGFDVIAEQVKTDIRDNPVILEHIGNINEIELDLTKSSASGAEDEFVFNL